MLELLSLEPIQRGLITLLISGVVLPICGIPLIELNLLPMRFMLMHGALLGGAIAISFGINPIFLMIGINILFVITITYVNIKKTIDLGRLSSFFMVAALGGTAIITQKQNVPGQSVLGLLWGSPYALDRVDLIVFIAWATVALFIFIRLKNSFIAYMFDPIMAKSLGVNTDFLTYLTNILVGVSVALAMKLLGALLVDVLLILPVVLAGFWKRGQKFYILLSVIIGTTLTLIGTLGSLLFDLPVSGVIAIVGSFTFLILLIFKGK